MDTIDIFLMKSLIEVNDYSYESLLLFNVEIHTINYYYY